MKLLLLEDDQVLSETLEIFLSREGFLVDLALNMDEAIELSFENTYDLYLFDINLPKGSGLELLQSLRFAQDNTPTIFITALTDMDSMAKGFGLGAMDYIKKPFEPQELLLRIKSKFRDEIIAYHDIRYDPQTELLHQNGALLDLGNIQHKILVKLLSKIGELVSKEELYEYFENPSSNALRVLISQLQHRLHIDITNIRAKGYMLEKI